MSNKVKTSEQKLYDILGLRRGAGSIGEQIMIDTYILPTGAVEDDYGNFILKIGDSPKVMWSAHTDTVHSDTKVKDVRQKLFLVDDKDIVSESDCLGGDNGAGVWLLLELISAGIEGLYIFHREEEIGGLGSRWIARTTPEVVKGINYAIAFDRRGTTSVITHQGTRTCSDAFAKALCDALGMDHVPDDGGTFTDTKSYSKLIPECTNISAGFKSEHTPNESLDRDYLFALRDALLTLDVTKLPVARAVTDHSWPPYWKKSGTNHTRSSYYDYDGYYDQDAQSSVEQDSDGIVVRPHAALIWQYPYKTYDVLKDLGVLEMVLEELKAYEKNVDGY